MGWRGRVAKAAVEGHLEVLKWAVEHGCPWDADECLQLAETYEYVEVAQWVRAQDAI